MSLTSKILKYAAFAAGLLTLHSCYEDILVPDAQDSYVSKLVVNAVLETGTPFDLQLTNTESVQDTFFPKLVRDAVVTLNVNGNQTVMNFNQSTELYESNVIPNAGDDVRLDIRSSGYPVATSFQRVPASISATSTLVPEGGRDSSGILSDLLKIEFQDDPLSRNYYKISFYYYDQFLAEFVPMQFTSNDPSIAEYNSFRLNDGSVIFNDELFNGKTKTISTVAPFGLVITNPNEKYLIQLESISEDYYKYINTLQRARDSREVTFTSAFNNAVVIYSNISNGLGILGSSYTVKDTLY
ncbi:DUF4249 domain-containing protein [bacterium]|nr:DUF4249 domain-containing protein [bacterium]